MEACLSPDLSELVRASQHFNSQFESIRKLAADQWEVNKLAAFQNSIKAAATLPPNILALSQVSARINSQFASIGKALAADTILARGDRDLQLETKEVLTPRDVAVIMPTLAMPSVRLRPKRLASVSEEYWLGIDRDVTAVSRDLFDDGHFAQAVFEAAKLYDNEVKKRSMSSGGRGLSGAPLMSEAFSPKQPVLTVADCSTATGQDIQQGTMFLSMGIMLRIRNPLGHENITLSLDEAKDWIVFISRLMKDLKRAPLW